jgi:hypothetical protein
MVIKKYQTLLKIIMSFIKGYNAWYFRTNLFGADQVVNIKSKSKDQVWEEIDDLSRGKGIDVILDIVGLEQSKQIYE